VHAWVNSPQIGEGPRIGSWEETVRYFQDRPRGYAEHEGALHRVNASHPPADAVWPLAAEVEGGGALLRRLLPLLPEGPLGIPAGGVGGWPAASDSGHGPALHSSWLCPEMPFSIVFDLLPRVHHVVNGLPHPAAGRVSTHALRTRAARRAGSAGAPPASAAAAAVAAEPLGDGASGCAAARAGAAARTDATARSDAAGHAARPVLPALGSEMGGASGVLASAA
jgi:hypothetical protein